MKSIISTALLVASVAAAPLQFSPLTLDKLDFGNLGHDLDRVLKKEQFKLGHLEEKLKHDIGESGVQVTNEQASELVKSMIEKLGSLPSPAIDTDVVQKLGDSVAQALNLDNYHVTPANILGTRDAEDEAHFDSDIYVNHDKRDRKADGKRNVHESRSAEDEAHFDSDIYVNHNKRAEQDRKADDKRSITTSPNQDRKADDKRDIHAARNAEDEAHFDSDIYVSHDKRASTNQDRKADGKRSVHEARDAEDEAHFESTIYDNHGKPGASQASV